MTILSFLATSRRAYPIYGRLTFSAVYINKSVQKDSFWTIGYLRSGYRGSEGISGPVWRVVWEVDLEVNLRSILRPI